LLQQTENFSHLMSGNKGEKTAASPQKVKPGRPKRAEILNLNQVELPESEFKN
jgi:hypothetical protein